jgi:Ca2+-binding RTX toxin-like protein
VFELEGRGRDEVRASVSYTLGDHVEALVLTGSLGTWGTGNGIGNRIDGNGGANRLSGGGGGDTILGGGGDDRIAGGAGQDRLTGGSGRDKFVFDQSAGGVNADRVTDFVRGSDTLLLENAVLTGIGEGGDLSSSRFAQGAATTDDHRVIYKASTGEILYDRDGDGGVAALRIGWVAAGLSLSASDFDVI